ARLGEQVLVARRAWNLKRAPEKLVRDTEDPLRRPDRGTWRGRETRREAMVRRPRGLVVPPPQPSLARVGANARLEAARSWLRRAQVLLEGGEGQPPNPAVLPRARALLQRGVRAAGQARAASDPRGLRSPIRDLGIRGD